MNELSRRTSACVACGLALIVGTAALAQQPGEVFRKLLQGISEDATNVIEMEQDLGAQSAEEAAMAPGPLLPGVINCAILTYANGKTSRCFSNEFLSQIGRETNITCNPRFVLTPLESSDLFRCPFAVMTGEGQFELTEAQRVNLRNYLENGGFIIASSGCSSDEWQASFRAAIEQTFPELPLKRLEPDHPVFHTVYDIQELRCKGAHKAHLEGLELDGKIAMIFSPDGLNDTGKAGPRCCCCGGNEIQNSRQMNINLLAYTLTH